MSSQQNAQFYLNAVELRERYSQYYDMFWKSELAQDIDKFLERLKSLKKRYHDLFITHHNRFNDNCSNRYYKKYIAKLDVTCDEFITRIYEVLSDFDANISDYYQENNNYIEKINYLYSCISISMSPKQFAYLQIKCNDYQDKIDNILLKISDLDATEQSRHSLSFTETCFYAEKGKDRGTIKQMKPTDYRIRV